MSWHVDSLDFVMFLPPAPGVVPDALQPWQKLFGTAPLSYQGATAGMIPPFAQAFGQVGDYNFSVQSQPGRLDLKLTELSPSPSPVPIGTLPPMVSAPRPPGSISAALDLLGQYALRMIDGTNPARLGLVLNLSKPELSAADATRAFCENVPAISGLPDGAIDLGFTLNLPKTVSLSANAGSAIINRLCKWNTARRQTMLFTINTSGGQMAPAVTMSETFTSTLQIDINSAPSSGAGILNTWTSEAAREIYSTFKEMASPILERGYNGLVSA